MVFWFKVLIAAAFFLIQFTSYSTSIVKKERKVKIDYIGKTLAIEEVNHIKKKFDELKSIQDNSYERIYYSDFDKLTAIEAKTLIPKSKPGKYKTDRVNVFEKKDVVEPGVFYGGHRLVEFAYPSVQNGAYTELNYTKSISDPRLLNIFYFDDLLDVEKAVLKVSIPKGVRLNYSVYNIDGLGLKYKVDTLSDSYVYTWWLENVSKREWDKYSPSALFYSPHILLHLASYETNKGTVNIAETPKDLFQWYTSLVKRIPQTSSTDSLKLNKMVNVLVRDAKTQNEKQKAIYNWVRSNIKYIAFEDGMAGFIPRPADQVFIRRYGDCKDMANLLKTMLNMAGVEAYLTWIGTDSRPYSYYDVPTPLSDNHMICTVKNDKGEFMFLDATNPFVDFSIEPVNVQGKEALIGVSDTSYKIVKVPLVEASKNIRKDSLLLKLQENEIVGLATIELSGYAKMMFRVNEFKALVNQESNFEKEFLALGQGNSLLNPSVQHSDSGKMLINMPSRFKSSVVETGDKLYINLNLDAPLNLEEITNLDSRKIPLKEDYNQLYEYICYFQIPQGYQLDFIPEDESSHFNKFSFTSSYEYIGGVLICRKTVETDFLILEKPDFSDFNDFLQRLKSSRNHQISLVKE